MISEKTGERRTSIELLRFLTAVMVVFIHCREFVYPDSIFAQFAYPVVDFFFLLSGFFAMRDAAKGISSGESAAEKGTGALPAAQDAVKYVWHKAKNIFSLYLFAQFFMFAVRILQKDGFSLSDALQELFHFKWEFFMLHMLGFNHAPAFGADYLLAPAWFVSSLMIALIPFYFLARRFGKTYSGVIAPICTVFLYAFIIQSYGTMNVGNEIVLNAVLSGNLRAFAGLSLGAFVFHISGWAEEALTKRKTRSFFFAMDIVSWVVCVSLFVFPKDLIPNADMVFWMIPFAFLLFNGLHDMGPVSRFFNSHGTAFWGTLGKLSMYLFLLHPPVIFLWKKYVPIEASDLCCTLITAIALGFSIAVMLIRERARYKGKAL